MRNLQLFTAFLIVLFIVSTTAEIISLRSIRNNPTMHFGKGITSGGHVQNFDFNDRFFSMHRHNVKNEPLFLKKGKARLCFLSPIQCQYSAFNAQYQDEKKKKRR
ncbi:unnamed protein product, partial [Mesorhabditis belari]|uniref:Uncharacterized protein n=1 Tax=Mesorhabditis belari TaxID=2138241 RepID=A0AAF3EKD2_9BILA